MEARVSQEPAPDHGRLGGRVVVDDQMSCQARRHFRLYAVEKLAKLSAAMTAVALANRADGDNALGGPDNR